MSAENSLASIYRLTAMNFEASAQRLHASFAADGKVVELNALAVPFYYLVSHAAELYLKAALLKNGATEGELKKRDRGHNLFQLVEDLKNKGATFGKTTDTILTELSDQHRRHLLRYNSMEADDVVFTPNAEAIFKMLQELHILSGLRTPLRPRPRRDRGGR
jgi:hypothetical protein